MIQSHGGEAAADAEQCGHVPTSSILVDEL